MAKSPGCLLFDLDRFLRKQIKKRRYKLILSLFPRRKTPDDVQRVGIGEINNEIFKSLQKLENISLLDITAAFLNPDKTMSPEVMNDFVRPTVQGYRIWAENMEPVLAALLAGA